MVTDAKGEITLDSQQGVYAIDTRFVGFYSLSINGQPWKLVNSSQITFYSSRIYLTNPAFPTEDGDVAEDRLGLTVDRYVEEGIHMVSSGFARGALKRLSEYQSRELDDYRDAQPGKILHEMRACELAHFHAIPHTPYYGTADATILYW